MAQDVPPARVPCHSRPTPHATPEEHLTGPRVPGQNLRQISYRNTSSQILQDARRRPTSPARTVGTVLDVVSSAATQLEGRMRGPHRARSFPGHDRCSEPRDGASNSDARLHRVARTSPQGIGYRAGGEMARHREPGVSQRDRELSADLRRSPRDGVEARLHGTGALGRGSGPPPKGYGYAVIGEPPSPIVAADPPVHGSFDVDNWNRCAPAVTVCDTGSTAEPGSVRSTSRWASSSPDELPNIIILRLPWSLLRRASSN